MGDFIDKSEFKNEAHLFFTNKGPVESFPLPGGKRRWIVTTDKFMEKPKTGYLQKEVAKRCGIDISKHKNLNQSPFGVQHFLSSKYYNNSIIFCGDACHVMSPIGGQGMNTGFADAELCAEMLDKILNKNINHETFFAKYEKYRKKAAITATRRAWISMRIGTIKGKILSILRNILIKILIVTLKNNIPPYFSMLTIPYSTLDKVKDILLLEKNKL
jgi:2-polyprenyl-6-methoxyphenol hydroxylase-like FAD-dependent oxidoreductase